MKGLLDRTSKRGKRGFTLLEVLLAVTLSAFILTYLTSFLFSMAELWGYGANERLFQKHARGVSRFLEQSFTYASAKYQAGDQGSTPVYWMEWEGDGSQNLEYLTFELEKSPGAFVWPEEPMPHVVCSLDFDEDEGLFILWRSRLEKEFDEKPPRRTLVSPFVTEVRYHYINYEEEYPEWEITDQPKEEADRSNILPQRIELVFRFKDDRISRQLILPAPMGGTPIL
ncbi:prepilin-type N-terminal cleavage/methylation domain-containing protein [Pelagicoccus sp. SDUM812003]|uniref:PulJ/GspJ family protein n=1 Tax=Pelagicoccus sp. SDUM812003 TaxID=3041267 RepID=UPI00281078C0|nr:prepilin-type N-terminal cleavage/methylation domain-containing protein [Pelagicoccus sp. SDUM812003]MDQ8202962.1 prepilin-type N-terminal cleavage/methylation domain-containing protein [Pelagicoccus sp. SDUM812003]